MYEIPVKCEPSSAENTTENEDVVFRVFFLEPLYKQILFSSVNVFSSHSLIQVILLMGNLLMCHTEQYNTNVILLNLNFVKAILLCKYFLCVPSIWKMAL